MQESGSFSIHALEEISKKEGGPTNVGERPTSDVWDAAGPWSLRTARIEGADGRVLFEQRDVEAPASWSQMAVNVVASKYLRGQLGTPERETSVRQLIKRVVDAICDWGTSDGVLLNAAERDRFRNHLIFLLLNQRLAFNSPVWFNVGIVARPQCSACFINSVEDKMSSILDLAKTEGMIFKYGSGAGVNLSPLRGKDERLTGGGTASGPVSFMRGYDAFAGVIKSGGRTRRAAKIIILNVDHPDVLDFVRCKVTEERKARVLADAGLNVSLDGDASVCYQNANNAVRVTDAFMEAVERDADWPLIARTSGEVLETVPAREIWREIVSAAHACGDPGLQFDDAVNFWHTCPADGRINSSNPCAEFVFLDNSACNLASLNLRKFQREDGTLDAVDFGSAVEVAVIAQEILVDRSSYPTRLIEENSQRFRPLGLGYTNLGAFLMVAGLPYDSDVGRAEAAAITSLMTAAAYRASVHLAINRSTFSGYMKNAIHMSEVIKNHALALRGIEPGLAREETVQAARECWEDVQRLSESTGFRNAQVTLLAPTGTISFMLDADTTGIEPDFALVKRKKLSGGGELLLENESLRPAIRRLGYSAEATDRILRHLRERGTLEDSGLDPKHLPVFDCASADSAGREIHWSGHVRMMEAVQPHLSGAISKTVNLPSETTPEEIGTVYKAAWRAGLKSITVYRDGCKRAQPLTPSKGNGKGNGHAKVSMDVSKRESIPVAGPDRRVGREKLPRERDSKTHKFDIAGHEGYVTAGMYPDGRLGEVFVTMAKEGATLRGLMDAWATTLSIALQYGVPWNDLADKFRRTRFEPSGYSDNPEIGAVTSPLDYIVRWVDGRFPDGRRSGFSKGGEIQVEERVGRRAHDSGPPCHVCGAITEPNGACYRCPVCGTATGCG
jgi:ribonucleoside-diphosphate reductase alpha chain